MPPPRPKSPEELYLEKKLAELGLLESRLAEKELELHTLRGGMLLFEKKYQAAVSEKYAKLDDLRARIAEILVAQRLSDETAKQHAEEQRAKAEKSARTAAKFRPKRKPPANSDAAKPQAAPKPAETFNPAESLKRLYRDVAKACHPDLADTDAEREHRHAFMIRVNEAYEAANEKQLLAVFQEWEVSPEAVKGAGAAAELIRAIRKIARCERRLVEIDNEMAELQSNALFGVMTMTEEAERFERDLLAETVARFDDEIEGARTHLKSLGGDPDAPPPAVPDELFDVKEEEV